MEWTIRRTDTFTESLSREWAEDSRDLSRGRNRPFAYHDTLSPRRGTFYARRVPIEKVYAIGDEVAIVCFS